MNGRGRRLYSVPAHFLSQALVRCELVLAPMGMSSCWLVVAALDKHTRQLLISSNASTSLSFIFLLLAEFANFDRQAEATSERAGRQSDLAQRSARAQELAEKLRLKAAARRAGTEQLEQGRREALLADLADTNQQLSAAATITVSLGSNGG